MTIALKLFIFLTLLVFVSSKTYMNCFVENHRCSFKKIPIKNITSHDEIMVFIYDKNNTCLLERFSSFHDNVNSTYVLFTDYSSYECFFIFLIVIIMCINIFSNLVFMYITYVNIKIIVGRSVIIKNDFFL